MQSLRKSGERPDLIPDAVSFTSIVSALAKDSIRGNVKERMLDAMFSILKDDDGKEIKLDSVAYNALIHAQSNQSGSADKAEKLLDFMLEQGSNSTIRPVRNYFSKYQSYHDLVMTHKLTQFKIFDLTN